MKSTVIVDTNVLLRLILADEPKLSLSAKEIFTQAETGQTRIYLDEIVVAETIWVLSSFYRQSRQNIAANLIKLLSQRWIVNPRKKLILAALRLFETTNFSYIDAWIFSLAKSQKIKLETFDRKLGKN